MDQAATPSTAATRARSGWSRCTRRWSPRPTRSSPPRAGSSTSTFAARFRQYSFNNTLLILIQCPDATHVASYKKWAEMGRQVRKGEKGLQIFAPMTRKREDETTGEEKRYVSGFRLVSVFDVAQTDGDALPEDPAAPVLLDGEAPEGLWESLAAMVVDANGYTLQRGPSEHGENGYTRPSDKVDAGDRGPERRAGAQDPGPRGRAHAAALRGQGASPRTRCCTATSPRSRPRASRYIVASVHGLADRRPTRLPYVAGWSNGKTEAVAATADRVLKTAKQILAVTEDAAEMVAV